MPNWSRWIAVLPAALMSMVLSAFLLHLVLYQTLTGSGIVDPYPETPERVLLPLVGAVTFIWVGARVAPNHTVKVAASLFILWLFILGGVVVLVLSAADTGSVQLNMVGGGMAPVMALIGAIVGFYIVRKENALKT
jgi:hypothetical protein